MILLATPFSPIRLSLRRIQIILGSVRNKFLLHTSIDSFNEVAINTHGIQFDLYVITWFEEK